MASFDATWLDAFDEPHATAGDRGAVTRYWQFVARRGPDLAALTIAIQHDPGATEAVLMLDGPRIDDALEALASIGGSRPSVTWRLDQPDRSRLSEVFGR